MTEVTPQSGRAAGTLPLAVVTAVVVIVVAGGAWNISRHSEPYYNNDEPRHIMTSVFWHDFFRIRPVSDPVGFTYAYYGHYPAIAPLHWPPLLHTMTGLLFLFIGPSVVGARVVVLMAAVGMYLATFALARRSLPAGAAALAVVLLGTTTILIPLQSFVMLEVPCMLLMVLTVHAMLKFAATGRARDVWLCAIFAAAGMLTKQHAVAVYPVLLAIAVTGFERRHWRNVHLYSSFAVSFLATVGYYLFTLSNITSAATDLGTPANSAVECLWQFATGAGPLLVVPAIMAPAVVRLGGRRDAFHIAMIVWVVSVLSMFLVVGTKSPRYLVFALPPMAVLGASVLWDLASRVGAPVRVAVGVLLAGVLLWNMWSARFSKLSGYEAAAVWATQAAPNGVVTFGGRRDATFVLYRRLHDPELETTTYRADKLVGCGQGIATRGYRAFVESEQDVRSVVAKTASGAVVIENVVDIDVPEHRWFWNVVRTDLKAGWAGPVADPSRRITQIHGYRMSRRADSPTIGRIPAQVPGGFLQFDPSVPLSSYGAGRKAAVKGKALP